MKGLLLAGGTGTRLDPLTRVTNKHLLPVYNQPMVFYPLQTLQKAGLKEVMVVVGGNSIGDFLELLQDGKEFGLSLTYRYQAKPLGIAHAVSLAEDFAQKESLMVILGDNIVSEDFRRYVRAFEKSEKAGMIFLKKVDCPERFGVPVIEQGEIVSIEEKPKHPRSQFAVIGVYFYKPVVFPLIRKLSPSRRGELEISDLHNLLLQRKSLGFAKIRGHWTDAGTFESLYRANKIAAHLRKER